MPMRNLLCALLLWILGAGAAQAGTLQTVQHNGVVRCGVSTGLPGFSITDNNGIMRGFDADVCRAVAAAIFGDAQKVAFVKLSSKDRFAVLKNGEVDVLSRNTTRTFSNEVGLDLVFPAYTFFDGQGFMVRDNITDAQQLAGATLCTQTGTTAERNAADYFRQRGQKFQMVVYEKLDESLNAYQQQRCDAFTNDVSGLYALRLKLYTPSAHKILPQTISDEPFALVVRAGDDQWARVVAWSFWAMVHAESLQLNTDNVLDAKKNSTIPAVRRLLGSEETMGAQLGLPNDWALHIIAQVGNYKQIFDRNLGAQSALNMPRGRNALVADGGLLMAPPLR